MCRALPKTGWYPVTKLEKMRKGPWWPWSINRYYDWPLAEFFWFGNSSKCWQLRRNEGWSTCQSLSCCVFKIKYWHYPHCPTGPDSWCKYNIDKLNGTQSYKPGPGFPLDIIAKIKPIYADLGKDSELEKCLHGKTQNANESFSG